MGFFLSHRQSTGREIALPLFSELEKLGATAFLDIKAEFEMHGLNKLVALCDYFVFIMMDDIFNSQYCLKGKIYFQ